MASLPLLNIEEIVKEKVEKGLKDIAVDLKGRETRESSKLSKKIAAVLVPKLAKVITMSVSAAVSCAFKEVVFFFFFFFFLH